MTICSILIEKKIFLFSGSPLCLAVSASNGKLKFEVSATGAYLK